MYKYIGILFLMFKFFRIFFKLFGIWFVILYSNRNLFFNLIFFLVVIYLILYCNLFFVKDWKVFLCLVVLYLYIIEIKY